MNDTICVNCFSHIDLLRTKINLCNNKPLDLCTYCTYSYVIMVPYISIKKRYKIQEDILLLSSVRRVNISGTIRYYIKDVDNFVKNKLNTMSNYNSIDLVKCQENIKSQLVYLIKKTAPDLEFDLDKELSNINETILVYCTNTIDVYTISNEIYIKDVSPKLLLKRIYKNKTTFLDNILKELFGDDYKYLKDTPTYNRIAALNNKEIKITDPNDSCFDYLIYQIGEYCEQFYDTIYKRSKYDKLLDYIVRNITCKDKIDTIFRHYYENKEISDYFNSIEDSNELFFDKIVNELKHIDTSIKIYDQIKKSIDIVDSPKLTQLGKLYVMSEVFNSVIEKDCSNKTDIDKYVYYQVTKELKKFNMSFLQREKKTNNYKYSRYIYYIKTLNIKEYDNFIILGNKKIYEWLTTRMYVDEFDIKKRIDELHKTYYYLVN